MTKPNAVDIAVEAYREVLGHLGGWAGVAIAPAVIAGIILVAGGYVAGLVGGFFGTLIGIAFSLVAAAFNFCIYIAWFRAAHSGFSRVAMVLPLAPSSNERHFLAWAIGIVVLPGAVVSLVQGGSASAAGMVAGNGLLGLVVAFAVLVLAVRLSFFFEDLALDKVTTPGTSFNATGPHFAGILGSVIMVIIPIVIVFLIIGIAFVPLYEALGIVGLAILQLIGTLVGAFGAALTGSVVNAYYKAG